MKIFHVFLCSVLLWPLLTSAVPRERQNDSTWTVLPPRDLKKILKDQPYTQASTSLALFSLPKEEQEKLRALHQSDPEAARKFVLQFMEERKKKKNARKTSIRQTATAVRTCREPEEKAKLTADLRKLVQEDFDETSREIELQLWQQEVRLLEIRAGYRERIANTDQLVDGRMKRLLTSPRKKKRQNAKAVDAQTGATPKAEGTEK